MVTFIDDDKTVFGDSIINTPFVIEALYHCHIHEASRFVLSPADLTYIALINTQE